MVFCGKRDARSVLVLQKYFPYFRDFAGICSNLVYYIECRGNVAVMCLFSLWFLPGQL